MTRWMRAGPVAVVVWLAAAGAGEAATEAGGSGRAGACGVMGFATFGADEGTERLTIDSEDLVDVIGLDLELPCPGPVLATFYAQGAQTLGGGNYSVIFLVAECVPPAVPGGCNLGSTFRAQPRGEYVAGPNSPFFQAPGDSASTATMLGVFPSLARGHYVFKARGKVLVPGQLEIDDRALIVQAYGTPPPPSAGR